MRSRPLCADDGRQWPRSKETTIECLRRSKVVLWAWLDLNQRPHPYQGSALGLVCPGWDLRLGRRMYRWRPLGTARLRWHVDQRWTRPARSRGQRRSAWRTLAGKETPAGCPRQASPAWAIALLGGALAGSGPGTSPCIDGLSLVTGMVIPQPPAGSNHAHYGGWLGPHGTSRLMRAIRPLSINPA
jgi:hypothetical protein